MEALNQLLGLTNEASEGAQVAAIGKIIEARNAAETALAAEKESHAATTTTLNDTTGKLLVAEAQILQATNESKKIKAEQLVKELGPGRIAEDADTQAKWITLATNDHAGTEALLKGINLNKQAPKLPTAGERSKDAPVISAAQYASAPVVRI